MPTQSVWKDFCRKPLGQVQVKVRYLHREFFLASVLVKPRSCDYISCGNIVKLNSVPIIQL